MIFLLVVICLGWLLSILFDVGSANAPLDESFAVIETFLNAAPIQSRGQLSFQLVLWSWLSIYVVHSRLLNDFFIATVMVILVFFFD